MRRSSSRVGMNRTMDRIRRQREAEENAAYYGPGGQFEHLMGPEVIKDWKNDEAPKTEGAQENPDGSDTHK